MYTCAVYYCKVLFCDRHFIKSNTLTYVNKFYHTKTNNVLKLSEQLWTRTILKDKEKLEIIMSKKKCVGQKCRN